MTPDIAIFRIPSAGDDPEVMLVQLELIDGIIDSEGDRFSVNEGDSYLQTDFDHIILAQTCDGGSHNDIRFQVGSNGSDASVRVCDLPFYELRKIVQYLAQEYEAHHEANHRQDDSEAQG